MSAARRRAQQSAEDVANAILAPIARAGLRRAARRSRSPHRSAWPELAELHRRRRLRCARATSRSTPPSAPAGTASPGSTRSWSASCTDRLKLEEDIRSGIKAGEFVPFFQPLIDLDSPRDHRLRGARTVAFADPRLARSRELHRGRGADRADRPADHERHRAGAEGSARLARAPARSPSTSRRSSSATRRSPSRS